MTIAEAIREYRVGQGMTQKDLAIKIDKTVRSIKRYESGETVPPLKVLDKIFNKSVEDIICKGVKEV